MAGAPNQDCTTDNLLASRLPMAAQDISGNRALLTDGAASDEGAEWDALSTLILESNFGHRTYDLGQSRSTAEVFIQADANDTYTIWGSV